jgi:hypothetical protein
MRSRIGLVALAVALVLPAVAGAGQDKTRYLGSFESSGTLQFVVKKTDRGKKVFNFRWTDFPLDCKGGEDTSSNGLTFGVRVRNGRFETQAVDNPDNPGSRLFLEGRLEGVSASGTMRLRGKRVPVDGPGRKECDSGTVDWSASQDPL